MLHHSPDGTADVSGIYLLPARGAQSIGKLDIALLDTLFLEHVHCHPDTIWALHSLWNRLSLTNWCVDLNWVLKGCVLLLVPQYLRSRLEAFDEALLNAGLVSLFRVEHLSYAR